MEKDKFVTNAIVNLRVAPYKGIHTVFSGMNDEFRGYFGKDADPIAHVQDMVARGVVEGHPSKGGWAIYLKGEMPERFASYKSKPSVLNKILGTEVVSNKATQQVASKKIDELIALLKK